MEKRVSESFRFMSVLAVNISDSQQMLCRREDASLFRGLLFFAAGLFFLAGLVYVAFSYQAGFSTINRVSYSLPIGFLHTLTFLGDTSVGLALILLFARRNPAMLVITFFALVYGSLLSNGMKMYFDMPRPPAVLGFGTFFQTGDVYRMESFPSGHSLSIFTLVSLFFYFAEKTSSQVLLISIASMIALSRILVGAHWPVDVLVGSALGVVTTLCAIQTAKKAHILFSLTFHLCVLSFLLVSTVYLFGHDGGYSLVKPFAMLLSSLKFICV